MTRYPKSFSPDKDESSGERQPHRTRSAAWFVPVAAGLTLLLLLACFILWVYLRSRNPQEYREYSTTDNWMQIDLADGSQVILEDSSRIRFPNQGSPTESAQSLKLEGRATFLIASARTKAAIIEAGPCAVRSEGGLFHLDASDSLLIILTTHTGNQFFYPLRNLSPGVLLTEGQRFSWHNGTFSHLNAPQPVPDTSHIQYKSKSFHMDELLDFLFTTFDGRFNTGPYGHFDKGLILHIRPDEDLPAIIQQIKGQAVIKYRQTCPDCFEVQSIRRKK